MMPSNPAPVIAFYFQHLKIMAKIHERAPLSVYSLQLFFFFFQICIHIYICMFVIYIYIWVFSGSFVSSLYTVYHFGCIRNYWIFNIFIILLYILVKVNNVTSEIEFCFVLFFFYFSLAEKFKPYMGATLITVTIITH